MAAYPDDPKEKLPDVLIGPGGAARHVSGGSPEGLGEPVELWTVYDHPLDFPDRWVARRWLTYRDGTMCGDYHVTASTLEGVRKLLPPGLHRLARDPSDDAKIVETWL
jgi:hypothetical protein